MNDVKYPMMKDVKCLNCGGRRFQVTTKRSVVHTCVKCKAQYFFTKNGLRRKK